MQTVTNQIKTSMESSSWIRKMFEKGLELKRQYGEDAVCDFSLGNPDVPPPAKTRDALAGIAANAVKPLGLGYCPNAGIPSVRETMAGYLSRQQKTSVVAKDVVMTVGAAGALVAFFRAVVEPGDEVLSPAPYFVEYGAYCGHFGGVLKTVPSLPPSFRPDIDGLARAVTPRTRAIIVNSPNNPTGCIYPAEDMERIAALVDSVNEERAARGERPMFLLCDEPYRAFAYDGAEVPAAMPLTKWACVLGSFSKTLSLAGERIGYFAANPAMPDQATLVAAVTMTNRTLGFVNAPVIGQRLAAALVDETVDLGVYDRRRKLMADVLRGAGVEFEMPRGAFYFFAKSPCEDDMEFVDALLEERILVVTGKGFGFGGYVRLSCSVEEAIIERSRAGFARTMERMRAGGAR
jgi:aspartate aminotransferase